MFFYRALNAVKKAIPLRRSWFPQEELSLEPMFVVICVDLIALDTTIRSTQPDELMPSGYGLRAGDLTTQLFEGCVLASPPRT